MSHPHTSHKPGTIEQVLEDIELVNLELELGDIKGKPVLYVLNAGENTAENDISSYYSEIKNKFGGEVLTVYAKLEEEMIDLDNVEKKEMFKMLEWERSALERLIQEAYKLLNLISFYTVKGGKEVHAWSLKKGSNALEAAAVVHTDFAKNFIKAEAVPVNVLLDLASGPEGHPARRDSWKEARQMGKVNLEGKDYVVADKEVIEFKIST